MGNAGKTGGRENGRYLALLLTGLVLTLSFSTLNTLTGGLRSSPSCLYGCDIHHEMGVLMDSRTNPGHTWQSSSHDWLGLPNNFPKGAALLRAGLSRLFRYGYFETWQSVAASSYLLLALGFFGWLIFYRLIFPDRLLNLLLAVISMNIPAAPYFKYSSPIHVFLPYLLISFVFLLDDRRTSGPAGKTLAVLLASVMTVVVSHLHAMGFFIAYIFLGAGFLQFFFRGTGNARRTLGLTVGGVILLSLAANFLAGWWYQVLVVHRDLDMASRFGDWPAINSASRYVDFVLLCLRDIYLLFDSGINSILCLFSLAGTAVLLWKRGRTDAGSHTPWLLAGVLLSVFSFLVTVPLLGKHLSPYHALLFLRPLFAALMAAIVMGEFSRHVRSEGIRQACIALLTILALLAGTGGAKAKLEDRFWAEGRMPHPPRYLALQEWFATEGGNPSDVIILSTNELSFAVHGFTGAKLVTGRRSHFFLFGKGENDFQEVWMDAAIVLYGRDGERRQQVLDAWTELARKTGKTLLLYWDPYWVKSEWAVNDGRVSPFDPFRFEYSPKREAMLNQNGIRYKTVENAVFDPSVQNDPGIARLTLMYVTPDNYRSSRLPWSEDLDQYLEGVWRFDTGGEVDARLFRIVAP